MKIRINGEDADIQLETEKTVGDILSALEAWLVGKGHRLSGLGVDGQPVDASSVARCFDIGIDEVGTLDIYTSSVAALFSECLVSLRDAVDEYEASGFGEKASVAALWNESPAAKMLESEDPGLADWAGKTFSGEGSGPAVLRTVVEERMRELREPDAEMDRISGLVADVCARLEELPLDVQTGKDARAAETVSLFSGIAEKVLRIYGILGRDGFHDEAAKVGELPMSDYVAEFHSALSELLNAYEQNDSVLVGDIAEYEISPRLRGLHAAVSDAAKVTYQ